MVCPKCQEEMTPGKVAHTMPFLSLNLGLSSKDLFFYDDAGGRQRILKSNQQVQAFRCESCASILIVEGRAEARS
jgi:hypothetical protein